MEVYFSCIKELWKSIVQASYQGSLVTEAQVPSSFLSSLQPPPQSVAFASWSKMGFGTPTLIFTRQESSEEKAKKVSLHTFMETSWKFHTLLISQPEIWSYGYT